MNFLDLPSEIILHIASFLSAESLSCLNQTCKQLRDVTNIDSPWQALVYQDYQIASNVGWNLSYREVYTKVLRKFRHILGLKRLALVPYGGLVNVCWADGEIQVNRYLSKPEDQAYSKLLRLQLYSLRWNESLQDIEAFCVQCPSDLRPAILVQTDKYPLLQCVDPVCQISHTIKEVWHGQSDRRFTCSFDDNPDAFKNFSFDKGYNCPMVPVQIPTGADQANSPIQLGLYTGDYGTHGVEILNFRVSPTDPRILEGLKILGDPNVPAGNISVTVNLNKPIVLTDEDQESVLEMMLADEQRTDESFAGLLNINNSNSDLLRQPFLLPEDCFDRGQEAPNTCLARYIGLGRIAGHLYEDPTHCSCHFIQFSDVKFGVMWLDLHSFSIFYKVEEDFPLCEVKSSTDLS